MINTESLEKILRKKKDRTPALLEVLRLTAALCGISDDKFDNNFNLAIDKVNELLFLQSQSKKTCGYTLTKSDYKSVGIFESHLKKHRKKSKPTVLKDKLLKIMPKLFLLKKEKNLNYTELKKYVEKRYEIKVSRTYLIKIFSDSMLLK